MGLGSSKPRLPQPPIDAIRALRTEVARLQGEVRNYASSYTSTPFEAYYESAMATARDVTELYRETRGRRLPDPDSVANLVALAESLASSVCAAFAFYVKEGAILLHPRPLIKPLASVFSSAGIASACLRSTLQMEELRRKGVRNGTLSVLKQRRVRTRRPRRKTRKATRRPRK